MKKYLMPSKLNLIATRWGLAFLAILVTSLINTQSWGQEDKLGKPSRTDELVSKLVAQLMQQEHLSKRPLDDSISERAFDMYIKSLDPMKAYFLESDIEEFSKWRLSIDDQVKAGDYTAAFGIFRRFLERINQRSELAAQLIEEDHDYTLDEEMITDPDLLEFPADDAAAREAWRKRIKYSLLVLRGDQEEDARKAKEKETTEKPAEDGDDKPATPAKKKDSPEEILQKRYASFARRMRQMDNEDVVERYISAITNSFDPHTSYMSRRSFENFIIQMGLELEGIGATLQGSDEGLTVIKSIVPGGAADTQGGLKVEDKIIAVAQGDDDGQRGYKKLLNKHGTDFVDVSGMKLDDVVGMIRGKAGTVVRLNVISTDSDVHTVKIVREKIKLEDSAAHGVIFEEPGKKIGVIDLPSFYAAMNGKAGRSTTTDVLKILNEFNEKNVDALVLDLRRNGGGSLREAIDCTGLFIDLGPVVQVKDARGQIDELNDENGGMAWDKPVVVLISQFSASASEILAGAVQDYNRGLVIGDTATHGKGTVQSLMNISQLIYRVPNPPNVFGALKITTSQFYRPNGDSTQKRGVLSDIVLPSITDKMDVGEADLDFPVEFDRVPPATFPQLTFSTKSQVANLAEKSQARLSENEEFQKRKKRINKYMEQKSLKRVSLNEKKFLERRRELNADKEDEKALEDQVTPGKKIERDYYMDEVLKITADYLDLAGN